MVEVEKIRSVVFVEASDIVEDWKGKGWNGKRENEGHWILTGGSTGVTAVLIIVDLFVRNRDVALGRECSRTTRRRKRGWGISRGIYVAFVRGTRPGGSVTARRSALVGSHLPAKSRWQKSKKKMRSLAQMGGQEEGKKREK